MTGPTKADLRARLDELGTEQPPSSATRDELLEAVAAADQQHPSLKNDRPRAAVSASRVPTRCAAGRPLYAVDLGLCRRCLLEHRTDCPGG